MGYGREMDGCGNFMKYSMFIINFIIFVGGVVVLALGIWTIADKSFMNELLGTNLYAGAVYILIATGALVTLISFLGCLGASKEVRCMLLLYFIIVFVIFVTMLIGGILGYVFRGKVQETMKQEMESSLRQYGNRREITYAWDETQSRLHCCGIQQWKDWIDHIPESCCKEPVPGKKTPCQIAPGPSTLYERGCLDVTADFVKENAAVIGTAGIVVALLMLLGMIFSCALFKMIE